ncbi:hypothetical protein [Rhizobium sp. Pop5]|nr:hypothetical protein [Rhizobium sp. Pop5]EJZ18832.1 GDP-mannose 4,6-dehydratase [Rhizobium sp. Pop5]
MDTGMRKTGKQLVAEMVREDLKVMARNVPSVGVTKGFAYA